jgi:DNA mismatch repair ATPase MutS
MGHGASGDRFRVPHHVYADDLDLFGTGSLFELLSTARTGAGEDTLARWLLEPATPDEIRARQDAIRELMPRLDLRETMAVLGDDAAVRVHAAELRAWAAAPIRLRGSSTRIALFVMAAITVTTTAAWAAGLVPGWTLAAVIAVQSAIALWFKTRVEPVAHGSEAPARDLDLLADVLRVIETETFTSRCLTDLQARIARGGRTASGDIRRLAQLVAALVSRENVFFALPAALMLWATQFSFAIETWRDRAGRHIPHWLAAAGEFEALLALASFSAEHPDYAFPEFTDGPAQVSAASLAHPLLARDAVPNDVALGGTAPWLLLVSGSNMSGKSTLLRALGLNVVLAQAGAPVRAASFRLTPLAIGASIRILDSLQEGHSRFFAEITRLKQIVDLTRAHGGAALFLLDEILGGTNSHDRRHGAEGLLTGLVQLGAIGLATTHDLALGAIVDRLDGRAANVHFVDRFDQGRLSFDYRLRPGIVQTSNAIALMQSIGLDI